MKNENEDKTIQPKLNIFFVLFLVIINFPILSLAIHQATIFGIPSIIIFIFSVWLLCIIGVAIIINK